MVQIRPARPADAAGIARVHVEAWRSSYAGILPESYLVELSEQHYTRYWQTLIKHQATPRMTLIAEDNATGIIYGYAYCGAQRTALPGYSGEFYALYLHETAQSLGLGRCMMGAMAGHLQEQGLTSACVWVLRENPARWFYERMGGTCLAEQPIVFAGTPLTEVAYGWPDLATLRRMSAGPTVG